MDDTTALAAAQLERMRGMTVEYHRRFFGDIRTAMITLLALFVLGFWAVPAAFLLVPFVALYGAAQTAFDASYLIFARQYAARLEQFLDGRTGTRLHVGSDLENRYLFPLDERKVVTAAFGSGFTWFGFMTLFLTSMGLVAAVFGFALGWANYLGDQSTGWVLGYVVTLVILTGAALATGVWWFVGGEGERRLRSVLDTMATA